MKKCFNIILLIISLVLAADWIKYQNVAYASEDEALLSDSFEFNNMNGDWSGFWMRDKGDASQGYDTNSRDNSKCLFIESKSKNDWSYTHKKLISVEPGVVFSFSGSVRTEGEKVRAALSVILYDKDKEVIQWNYAKESLVGLQGWTELSRRFIAKEGVKYIRFRLTGGGVGKAWFDNISFKKMASEIKFDELQKQYTLENDEMMYRIDTEKKDILVLGKKSNKEWIDSNTLKSCLISRINKVGERQLELSIIEPEHMKKYTVNIILSKNSPEIDYEINIDSDIGFSKLEFPQLFNLSGGMKIVVPIAEGMIVPFDDFINNILWRMRVKGGWPMAFIGVLDGDSGWMEIIETPNDFEVAKVENSQGKSKVVNRWVSEKGSFSYTRKIKYYFFDKGGYVAMAKRYRQYAHDNGLFKSLKQKDVQRKGNIGKLIGSINAWYWGVGKYNLAKEMKKSGLDKILFSNAGKWDIDKINDLGYLTSRYDIYQDVWSPGYHNITKAHDGWPEDLVLDEKGDWIKGWTIKKGLKEYPGGVICSIRGLERAKKTISQELKKKPYKARFIDTTTSTSWRECYNPDHPTTRTEDIKYKMALLKYVSKDRGLVTGSEDGADVAVPYVDYFEGMMSIGKGRLPGSGRGVRKVEYMKPTENFLKYQVGTYYRIPLWELVYHDAVVSTWYWGDSSNRIPEYWWKKDLFNILYGNMPLWAIRDWKHWKQYKDQFIESYNNVSPVFEKVGFKEMLSHRFVTEDHLVQETEFAGDIRVIVNFGDNKYFLANNGYKLQSKGFVVFEKGEIWREGISRLKAAWENQKH